MLCRRHPDIYRVSDKSISNVEVGALAPGLYPCSTLERLDLFNNNIGDAGAVTLAQALQSQLYSGDDVPDAGAVALAQTLHYNSILEGLDLFDNDNIGREGTDQL